ncbi:MAG: class III signal peptide-containing protein [Candidatus Omnitrophica bacterium]|nr:class III signal peptide-containing protein [Candidatus Omnitrophota bacterium]
MLTKRKKKTGQSTLEYIILVTAVIVIVIGLVVSPQSPFRSKLNSTFNTAISKMGGMGERWASTVNSEHAGEQNTY